MPKNMSPRCSELFYLQAMAFTSLLFVMECFVFETICRIVVYLVYGGCM